MFNLVNIYLIDLGSFIGIVSMIYVLFLMVPFMFLCVYKKH